MTNRQARNLFGAITLLSVVASEVGALTGGQSGTIVWLIGLLGAGVSSPIFGWCLRRCVDGHETEPWRGTRA